MSRWEFKAWITVKADTKIEAYRYAWASVEAAAENGVLLDLEDSEPDEIEDEQES